MSAYKLSNLIRARFPVIYITTFEEDRVTKYTKSVVTDVKQVKFAREVFTWTQTNGLYNTTASKTVNDTSDAVLMSRLANCENDSNISLKKVAVVNFDAFDDVTGKLSFALAILNNNNDGIILTSLYGHNSCNTYVREIVGGQTPIKLLDEENAALENAKSKLKRTENNG